MPHFKSGSDLSWCRQGVKLIYEMELKFTGFSNDPGGVLIWNSETGELSGYKSNEAREYADFIIKQGIIIDNRFGISTKESPLKDEMAMAILLSNMTYIIPEQLRKFVKSEKNTTAKYPAVN